ARRVHPARDRSSRRQAVRRLPVGAQAHAHPQEAREGAQGARPGQRARRAESPLKNTLSIVFAGTPEFAVPALEALLGSSHRVVAVYTQPDRPAGRGQQVAASAVKQCAVRHALPVEQPATLREPAAVERLQRWSADVMVVAAYGLLLPQSILQTPRLGCINIHASLLPRWRGAAPIQRARQQLPCTIAWRRSAPKRCSPRSRKSPKARRRHARSRRKA